MEKQVNFQPYSKGYHQQYQPAKNRFVNKCAVVNAIGVVF
jgi:hypothetical protein